MIQPRDVELLPEARTGPVLLPTILVARANHQARQDTLGADDFDGDTAERYGYLSRFLPDGEQDHDRASLNAVTSSPVATMAWA